MKFNFRKIASVLASTVMLSSTVALAAAANVPAPFVQDGKANALIVYGTNPAVTASSSDMVAAMDIQTFLLNKVNQQTGPTTTVTPSNVSGGDFVELNDGDEKTNLGSTLRSVYDSLTDEELSTILADGTYEDTDGEEYEYTQEITLGPQTLTLFADDEVDDDEKPVIGFDIAGNSNVLNYTLEFRTDPQNSSMDDTYLTMLGKRYYVSSVSSALEIELLDTANSVTVNGGESTEVTVGDKVYEVTLLAVNGGHNNAHDDTVTLSVNGKKLDATNVGNTRKIAEDTYVSILDATEADFQGDQEYAEISIGTGKIVLSNGDNLEMNDDTVDDVKSYISSSSGAITSITLEWAPEEESFLVPGKDLVMPGLEVVKLSMGGFVTSEPEEFSIDNNGDDYLELKSVDVLDGTVSSFPFLYTNTTKNGFGGLGQDSTHRLLTSGSNTLSLNDTQNPKFVATYISGDTAETYMLELTSLTDNADDENVTKISNLANNDVYEFIDSDDVKVGKIKLAISNTNAAAKTATLTVTDTSGGTTGIYLDRIVTAAGLTFRLPVDSVSAGDNYLNLTRVHSPTWTMNLTEANEDGDAMTGQKFTITMGHTAENGPEVTGTSVTLLDKESGSDDQIGYVSGTDSHATLLTYKTGDDNDVMDIAYHEDEAYAQVYVTESSAVIGTPGEPGEPVAGSLLVKDTEVTSTTNTNLIVVGGSCVNKVAAELVGLTYGADTSCGKAWEDKTGIGANSYLIESFARNGKIATLVAGYNAPDTTNAAMAFKTQTIDTTAGKKYKGTTGTTITPVVKTV